MYTHTHTHIHTHTHTMEYYSAVKKNEVTPLAATRMNLEIAILSEVSQIKKNNISYHLNMDLKYNTNLPHRSRLIDRTDL